MAKLQAQGSAQHHGNGSCRPKYTIVFSNTQPAVTAGVPSERIADSTHVEGLGRKATPLKMYASRRKRMLGIHVDIPGTEGLPHC